jgi:hypothetical protein
MMTLTSEALTSIRVVIFAHDALSQQTYERAWVCKNCGQIELLLD